MASMRRRRTTINPPTARKSRLNELDELMFKLFKKLQYGARVLLSKGGGQPETIEVSGRPTVLMHAGEGTPFVYLHSTLGESFMWFPFYEALSKKFRVLVPTHPGFGESGGFDQIDTIEDMAFHYVEMLDALGLEEVILGGVSLGGWIAAEFAVRWPERVKKLWIADAPGLWVESEPLPDLFRIMLDRQKLRELLFHDPNGAMATMVIREELDEQTMMKAYQSMTVLARLVWERPMTPNSRRDSGASNVQRFCSGATTTAWCRQPMAKPIISSSPARN